MYQRKLTGRVPIGVADYITRESVRGNIPRQDLVGQLIIHGLNDLMRRQQETNKEQTDVLPDYKDSE